MNIRAYTLRGTAYHIAANPAVRQRLYDELATAIPDIDIRPSLARTRTTPLPESRGS